MSEEITQLKGDMQNIKEKLNDIPTRQEMRADNLELVNTVLKKCDERYASKRTETAVFFVGGVIVLFAINQLLNLI